MVVENLLGQHLTPPEAAAFALKCGARASNGTNMHRLAALATMRWDMTVTETSDLRELLSALKSGAMAICNVSGNRTGHKGIFSTGGHYIVACGGDESCIQVLDPGMYPGKFRADYRAEAVTQLGEVLLCAPETLELDCLGRSPRYYIFEKA